MFYSILHRTRHEYSAPVSENLVECRMMPRSEGAQRCLAFELQTEPRSNVLHYPDHQGNTVHHFDIPRLHEHLVITARAIVEVVDEFPSVTTQNSDIWEEIEHLTSQGGDYWEDLMPSKFVQTTPALLELVKALNVVRRGDPYTLLTEINKGLKKKLSLVPPPSRVPSPLEEVLAKGKATSQDFSHLMIALVRQLGIPARYVNGYYLWSAEGHKMADRADTHSWVEVCLPGWGWVGFDPTHGTVPTTRHIRVATGRDYADVPSTRGVFQGMAERKIESKVTVKELQEGPKHVFSLPAQLDHH
ncbi:Transglutaminase-like enzyme, putative cysteine protease [Verrucomicrobium sp. GAS474]|uniref:transglutaminase family protein n=1 Tax=Verrucomicrobium sp. GAS474 TaxID=1882831 RepID=UPI00087B6C7D|nr:transglutaminase family protein [Verrucomicrobium sp. GAS474]SDU27042.1 Transglutaminase-like enzyme, putative cysteine protease [Verrucomicrobium sp. GAS474]